MRRPSGAVAKCSLEEAPAKHKIREASHSKASCRRPRFLSFSRRVAIIINLRQLAKHKRNCSMAPQKWPKCDASRRAAILFAALPLPAASCLPAAAAALLSLAAVWQPKSCKLMATGAHSKRFHYCHKLWPAPLPPEIALKNSAEYFSISAP